MAETEDAARLRASEKEILSAIRHDASSRLWHIDRQLWSKKGLITRCLAATIDELASIIETAGRAPGPDPWTPRIVSCVSQWTETTLSWADSALLVDVVQDCTVAHIGSEPSKASVWLVMAALSGLKADVAQFFLRSQAEEMARQRDDGLAAQHIAGRFLANASHELRTPLTAVLGFSELLLEGTYGTLSPEQSTAVGHIENSAQNLLEIVNNVLDLMQFRAGKLELQYRRVAVAAIFRNIFEILLPLSKRRHVRFTHEIPQDLGSIEADEGIVRHIVYHLLENALRATPENGEVVLRADRNDDVLTIVTYDTALHFPPEAIENMNDAYRILENSPARGYDGWEIGLPLVRRYVDLHSGTLDIESRPDEGTTIRVKLPTSRPAGKAKRPVEALPDTK